MKSRIDVAYTNGVIAVREKRLLKDKIFRFCELTAEEVFRALLENGFGGNGACVAGVHDFEKLIACEEEQIDEFIREYAPSDVEAKYLLSHRDFHNAKALIKAMLTGDNVDKMLLPDGLIKKETLLSCIQSGDFSAIEKICLPLKKVCEETLSLLETERSGAKIGAAFEIAEYEYLQEIVKRKTVLKKILIAKSDMTNILTALRAGDPEIAKAHYLPTGKLSQKSLLGLFNEDEQAIKDVFIKTPYAQFVNECLRAKEKGLPFTQAEKMRDEYDSEYFAKRKYALEKNEPFLYYVYRRKAECANVRIVMVCLMAGLGEQDIKRRLRNF